ncbi:hypothetical protein L1887_20962 [Cichorium endivia]|nr:hypothetical protein L1887_20962 [Cichorium endivia]
MVSARSAGDEAVDGEGGEDAGRNGGEGVDVLTTAAITECPTSEIECLAGGNWWWIERCVNFEMTFSPLTAFPFGVNVSDEIVTAPIKSKTCYRKRAKIGAEKNVLRFDVAVEDPFRHSLCKYAITRATPRAIRYLIPQSSMGFRSNSLLSSRSCSSFVYSTLPERNRNFSSDPFGTYS